MLSVAEEKELLDLLKRDTELTAYKRTAWGKVLKVAKTYAMLKTFGKFVNDAGFMEHLSHADVKTMTEQKAQEILRLSVDALAEDAQ